MKKNCGMCESRVQYPFDREHYICDQADKIKRVSDKHRVCSKYIKK